MKEVSFLDNLANNLALSLFVLGVVTVVLARILSSYKVPATTQRFIFVIVAFIYILLMYKSRQ